MSATFYLFDVDHGQSAALRLPNGHWCIFDVGRTDTFSPVEWIVSHETQRSSAIDRILLNLPNGFRFLKGTISHLHGDHLADCPNLLKFGPQLLRSVESDSEYLTDCYATCSDNSGKYLVNRFAKHYMSLTPVNRTVDYGGVRITELSLPMATTRYIGGSANSRVNNASVITRIDACGTSILLCGDMEKEGWEFALRDDLGENEFARTLYSVDCTVWQRMVSDIDILVAPHHGHRSGFSVDLLRLASPAVVLVSAVTYDPNVDGRYSVSPVRGMTIDGKTYGYISTRQKGHIKIGLHPPDVFSGQDKGLTLWTFGENALF